MGNVKQKLLELKSIVLDARPLGVETDDFVKKIESVLQQFDDEVLRIVLMGTFSDGKTSVVAGLLEQVKSNMKIDQDESSDEISIYRFDGVDNIEIIDTPGLFGTKEKEVDGEIVKFSDITKKYISESNVLIYICNAVNPLKESHVPSVKKVLRDLGKLSTTIFVLNKMDTTGADMLDDQSYQKYSETKKKALVKRLKETIGLTDEEEKNLKIICVAADPKQKGLEYWLTPEKKDSYHKRSHLHLLKGEIDRVYEMGDLNLLKVETGLSAIRDVVNRTKVEINTLTSPVEKSLRDTKTQQDDLSSELNLLRKDLIASMGRLTDDLQSYESSLLSGINGCSGETLVDFLDKNLGTNGESIDYHVVFRQVNQFFSIHCSANLARLEEVQNKFEQKYNLGGTIIEDAVKKGAEGLGKLKVDHNQVLKMRDFLAKHFDWAKVKFKPWGATKLASKITKGLGAAGGGLTFVLEIKDFIKERKNAKRLHEMKLSLKADIGSIFGKVYDMLDDEETFFKNFAPNYLEMREYYESRNQEISRLQEQIALLRQYNDRLSKWVDFVRVDDQTNLS